MTKHYRYVAACAMPIAVPGMLFAQESPDAYPSKPVRIISAQAPGGTDVQARLYASKLSESMGKQFIVDNHPGVNVAWTLVAKSPADGYTLLVILPNFTFAPALHKNLPVDPIRDFAPISLMSMAPYLLVTSPALPARSVKELISLAKAHPGKLNFGGGLPGAGTHLMAAWFISLTKIKASYVPYKGTAQTVVDLLGGRLDAMFSAGVTTIPHIKTGKLRALGTSAAQRTKVLPDIPTIAEQGVAGFDAGTFHGWAAPAGTSPDIIRKLSTQLAKVAQMPDVIDKLRADNATAIGSTPEQFARFIGAEVPRWRKLVQDSGITVDP